MCFSKELSKRALGIGLLSSLLLITLGNENLSGFNKTIGITFIAVALVQLADYFIWSDVNCQTGYNELGGQLGPLFINLQPVIIFALILLFMKDSNIDKYDAIPIILNVVYLIYFIYQYKNYIANGDFCSKVKDGHLAWVWGDHFNYFFYTTLLFINLIWYAETTIHYLTVIIIFAIAVLSNFAYKDYPGQTWCYFSNSIPLIVLLLQKFTNIS